MAILKSKVLLSLALSAFSIIAMFSSGCSSDPYDPKTWIEKLDDPAELEEAITHLTQLNCPEAIKPLGKIWETNNKWSKVLHLIISLADQPHMVKGHEKYPNQDCPDAGEGPYWKEAIPFLMKAVQDFDVTDEKDIADAALAAEALGKAKSTEAIQALISAAMQKQKLRQGQLVRIAALKALGEFGDNPKTVAAIVKVLEIPASRSTILLNAAAANALAAARSPKALEPLLVALFNISPIYPQVRKALTAIGKSATPALIKIFSGKHTVLNRIAIKNKFANKCEDGEGPGTTCLAPGNLRFKSATILGDVRATKAIPVLVKALSQKARVSFFDPKQGIPGPSDHIAILNALGQMGAYTAAKKVGVYMKAETTGTMEKGLAMNVYSQLAKSTKELDFLQATFENQENDGPLRDSARIAYSRLVRKNKQIAPIQALIDLQLKSAKNADKKSRKEKKKEKKKKWEGEANDYRGFARNLELHRTRARTGVVCGKDVKCYQEILELDAKGIVAKLKIPNHRRDVKKPMKKKDMQMYRIIAQERSLLEIAKMGKAGASTLDVLLKHAESSEGRIRKRVLSALVEVAPKSCNKCVDRLSEIIEAQSSQMTLHGLNRETQIIMNYFISQGAKKTKAGVTKAAPAKKK